MFVCSLQNLLTKIDLQNNNTRPRCLSPPLPATTLLALHTAKAELLVCMLGELLPNTPTLAGNWSSEQCYTVTDKISIWRLCICNNSNSGNLCSRMESCTPGITIDHPPLRLGLRTGTGKPVVPDKRVSRVWVQYHIWSTRATPRTHVTVSQVWTVFLGVHKALRYFFKYCHENLFADQGPPGSYSFFKI